MMDNPNSKAAGNTNSRRLFIYNGGFLTQKRVRRILELSKWNVALGKPQVDDWVGVWGKSPTSQRGEFVAEHTDAPILRVEDAFLRSLHTGRDGDLPIGLCLDERGVHFDSSKPSDLEQLLAAHPLDDTALLNRARDAIERLKMAHLSKYNAFDPNHVIPDAPYVLVIDQTKDDASIKHGAANAGTFQEMLVFAQTEHPGSRVIIKSHPETVAGHRAGHFGPKDESNRIKVLTDPVSPWALMDGATAVYTVSSQLGFEAILAGHQPRVFGQPFYSGWGLTKDENPVPRRERKLSRAQLFAAAMILYPVWYDPYRDQLGTLEDAIGTLEAQSRAWREDQQGYVATGMRLWKRKHMQQFFGGTSLRFAKALPTDQTPAKHMAWAGTSPERSIQIEDGFLRSNGLGAALTPPLSLVRDDVGIYYDPSAPSRLENLINASLTLPQAAIHRSEDVVRSIRKFGLSKYNLGDPSLPNLPNGHRILVPGQVEDDRSVLLGCDKVRTNLELLIETRRENPDAVIIYKPHPDVQAGLRAGKIDAETAKQYADVILEDCDPAVLLDNVNAVWTMTSLFGFEALIRSVPVTCLGMPFYAGWGLTNDLSPAPDRRSTRPTLLQLSHAVLIGYPRYHDPISNLPCSVEVAIDRLRENEIPRNNRTLSKLQGLFANYAHLWR